MAGKEKEKKELKLHSPSTADPVTYNWPLVKTKQYDAAGEIIDSIRFVSEEHKELNVVMQKLVKINQTDTNSFEQMKALCEQFSRAADTIRHLWRGSTRPNKPDQHYANRRLLQHVIQQVYNRSVIDPEKLNQHYEAFSPETYGETSFDMVQKIIEELKPSKRDIFLDLGSGVGQVVLHMAGGSKVRKAVGIEKASLPARYAENMHQEFNRWMKWYGKQYRSFEFHKGNFLDPKFRELLTKEATVIFVNNYAFGPKLDHELKLIFEELKDGTRIVSSKPFCDPNARLSDRRMTDLGAIMDVKELTPVPSSVSWTCNNVPYFLHVVNRKKLERYFFEQKNPQFREESRRNSKSSSKSSSRESSNSREATSSAKAAAAAQAAAIWFQDEEDKSLFGPTTRRQWNEWITNKETTHKEEKKRKPRHKEGFQPLDSPPIPKERPKKIELRKLSSASTSSGAESKIEPPPVESAAPPLPEEPKKIEEKRNRRGRPRKSETELKANQTKRKYQKHRQIVSGITVAQPTPKISSRKLEVQESLDILHQHTIQSVAAPTGADPESTGLVSLSVESLRDRPEMQTLPSPPPPSPPPAKASTKMYPGLDQMFDQMKADYIGILEQMQTIEFRQQLIYAIQLEKARQDSLRQRAEHLKRQVDNLVEDGVVKLKARLTELSLQAISPAELLTKSKEIVLRHKELQAHQALLKSEVEKLELHNSGLMSVCKDRDDQTVKSGILKSLGFSEYASVDSVKESILRDIGFHFNRQKALITEMTRVQNEVLTLQASLPPSILSIVEASLPPLTSIVSNPHQPQLGSTANQQGHHLPPSDPLPAQTPLHPSTPSIRGKRGRGRGSGSGGPGRKRHAPSNGGKEGKSAKIVQPSVEGKNQEEIERQIQDIVQKALSVDNAAKTAEKERKQKSADRKKAAAAAAAAARPANQAIVSGPPAIPIASASQAEYPTVVKTEGNVAATVEATASGAAAPMPTFSSPGLVPVFIAPSQVQGSSLSQSSGGEVASGPIQRSGGGEGSPETESAPSEAGDATPPEKLPRSSSVPAANQGKASGFLVNDLVGAGQPREGETPPEPSRTLSSHSLPSNLP